MTGIRTLRLDWSPREPLAGSRPSMDHRLDQGSSETVRRAGTMDRQSGTRLRRGRQSRSRPYQASSPFDARPDLVHHDLAVARGSMKFGCALSRIRCGRIRAWTRSVPSERELEGHPLHRRDSDHVWSNTKLPSAYQIGLPL